MPTERPWLGKAKMVRVGGRTTANHAGLLDDEPPVGVATIRRVEVLDGEIPVTSANEAAIRRAFEDAGIEFIQEDGGGEGVRFRKPRKMRPV